jgi:hypothetical protein
LSAPFTKADASLPAITSFNSPTILVPAVDSMRIHICRGSFSADRSSRTEARRCIEWRGSGGPVPRLQN